MALSDKDEAKARVETARHALDDDLATLSDRLPAASVIAQAGAAGGTGLALLGLLAKQVQKKLSERSEDKALTREAEIQARAIAAAIAAAGLHGHSPGRPQSQSPSDDSTSEVRVPVPPPTHRDDDEDDGGAPWGILLLLAALAGAVYALVNGSDDSDLWDTPGTTST